MPAAPAFAAQPLEFAPGRIIVEPRAGLSVEEMGKMLKQVGGGKARKLGQSNIHVVELPKGSEKAVVAKLQNNPHFKFAELDKRVRLTATTN